MFGGLLEKILLQESASVENVTKAMDNHAMVIINYHSDGKDNNTGSRVIEPIAYGLTKAGNPVIRAFQPFGDTTTVTPGWKFFRLDRISYWEETNRHFNELPDARYGEPNLDGDDSMSVVIKTFNSTKGTPAPSVVNNGPKTKQKIYAQTSGDKQVQLGARNIKNQESPLYIDLDNNKKVNNGFNMYTKNSQSSEGPRQPDQSYKPNNVSGSVKDGDIDPQELERAREQVYSNNSDRSDILNNDDLWTNYSHDYTDKEISQADFDRAVMNRENWQNKNLSTSRRKFERQNAWQGRADNSFLNRKDSGNRILYNMEHEDDEI